MVTGCLDPLATVCMCTHRHTAGVSSSSIEKEYSVPLSIPAPPRASPSEAGDDDAGIAFYVPARKTEKDAEEAPDGSEVEESEPVNHATGIMTDDAGLAIQQYDRYGSADNSGSKLKAVGDGPTSDAAQFEDATGHDGNIPLDSLTSRHDHKKYSMPFQEEAPIEGDTHMRQTAREALSVTTDSTSQDIPGSLAGDDSLSYLDPDQGDNSNSLSRRQTQRMGDLG